MTALYFWLAQVAVDGDVLVLHVFEVEVMVILPVMTGCCRGTAAA